MNENLDINYIKHLFSKRYEIIAPAGRGGMAWVFKARHLQLNRIVALKILRPELNKEREIINRFYQEIKMGATLNHPNILKIYYGGQVGDLHFMEMDFLNGESLFTRIWKNGRLSQKQTIRLAKAAAAALSHIHRHGIVHRDLKSGNIFMDSRRGLLITDFGISFYRNNSAQFSEDSILGTPEYMSPEQARGEGLPDHQSDLYSLGVILYECFTGNVPFKGRTPAETISSVIHDTPRSPRELQLKITNELEEVVMRLLSKNKNERYSSAYELFNDVDKLDERNSGADFFQQLRFRFRGKNKDRPVFLGFKLKQINSNDSEKVYPLTGKLTGNNQYTCVVGRATPGSVQPDVDIPDPTISRRHIEIVLLNGQLGVRHLYSENRTFVNGNRLEAGIIYQLKPGDTLVLGKAEFELMQ